jgi:hypothetical protein
MVGLQVGARVSVRLPKGTRYGQVLQERGGFYQCRFDDGATGWVDARDVMPEAEPLRSSMPPAEVFSQPPPASYVPPVYAPSLASEARPSRSPYATTNYACAVCGAPDADYFPKGGKPLHRHCAGLGPDMLEWPWLLYAYGITVPCGCTLLGAVAASIPYFVWRTQYPQRAKTYNRHVWIAFGCSAVLWLIVILYSRHANPPPP